MRAEPVGTLGRMSLLDPAGADDKVRIEHAQRRAGFRSLESNAHSERAGRMKLELADVRQRASRSPRPRHAEHVLSGIHHQAARASSPRRSSAAPRFQSGTPRWRDFPRATRRRAPSPSRRIPNPTTPEPVFDASTQVPRADYQTKAARNESDAGIWNFGSPANQSLMSVTTEPSDAELVGRMASGDREAFADLFRRHQATVFRFSRQMLGSREAAEDVTQDVFIALARSVRRFDPAMGSLTTYLYGIARNLILQRHKRSRWHQVDIDSLDNDVGALATTAIQRRR